MISVRSESRGFAPRKSTKSGRNARGPRKSVWPAHVRPYDQFTRFLRQGNSSLARDVARRLGARVRELSVELLGEPKVRQARTWRWGSKCSLVVNVAGERAGRWFSFEENQGGDALDLVAWVRRESLREALAYARGWLGGVK